MKEKILICGILPPPFFGHSMIYHTLMQSPFQETFDITFFNMKFWSYEKHKKVTVLKLLKFIQYYFQYVFLIIVKRPRYVLYAISFDKMPLYKDFVFCMTARALGCRVVLHDMGQYLKTLYDSGSSMHRRCLKSLMRHTTASIVLGDVTRNVYAGFIDPQRVISVLGSVEDSLSIKLSGSSREKESKEVCVLYFSFLSVSKGIWTALKAVPEALKANSNIRFIFAGPLESPQLKEEIDQFIKTHGLTEKVSMTGYVGSDEERTRYFRSADIFVFPTHRDVFGLEPDEMSAAFVKANDKRQKPQEQEQVDEAIADVSLKDFACHAVEPITK